MQKRLGMPNWVTHWEWESGSCPFSALRFQSEEVAQISTSLIYVYVILVAESCQPNSFKMCVIRYLGEPNIYFINELHNPSICVTVSENVG